jgi:hypothetical protein
MMTIVVLLTVAFAVAGAILWRGLRARKIEIWLPAYVASRLGGRPETPAGPIDVLFCFVDHYEPGWNHVDYPTEVRRVDGWHRGYPEMAGAFTDADGYHPRHSWFYPPHYYRPEHLDKLVELCVGGFGDVEMHLHHNRMEPFPDTSATLRKKIEGCLNTYAEHGVFQTTVGGAPAVRYAFIHGDWALDGSRPQYCAVNDELTILKETGCFADFTFPAYMVESQPSAPNVCFYATDDPARPCSHKRGTPVLVGRTDDRNLMIVQGPLGIRWQTRSGLPLPKVDDGEICANNPPSPERVDHWVRTHIHVPGRPEWVIVKTFTHGADEREHPVLLGDPIRRMHAHLREKYNDGTRYRLHYVTARELYNIIRAAEAGKTGNPGDYRDFVIGRYKYRSRTGD